MIWRSQYDRTHCAKEGQIYRLSLGWHMHGHALLTLRLYDVMSVAIIALHNEQFACIEGSANDSRHPVLFRRIYFLTLYFYISLFVYSTILEYKSQKVYLSKELKL